MQEKNAQATRLALRHYWSQLMKRWWLTVPTLVLPGIGSIFLFFIPPIIIVRLIARFNNAAVPSIGALMPYVLLMAGFWTMGELIYRFAINSLIKTETKGISSLYINAMDEMYRKDLSFFHDNFAGSLTKRVTGYAKNFEGFVDTLAFNLFANVIPLFFGMLVLWRYSPLLALTLVIMLSLAVCVITPFIIRRQKLVAIRETANTEVSGHIADSISNMDAVRAFANEEHEAAIHKKRVEDYMAKAKHSWDYQNRRVDIASAPMFILTNTIGLIVALYVSQNNGARLETVFLTFTYYTAITHVVWEFNRIYRNIESAITEAAQFTQLLLEEPKLKDISSPVSLKKMLGEVEFKNVGFRYDETNTQHLFQDFNFKIHKGEKVGLVGHSGGGKTTITKLLLRFMDPQNGSICVDGVDISALTQKDLRAGIAYVPQDPIMFHRTLTDNIRYGSLDATEAKVKEAAKLAHASEFIDGLPKGYDTLVGERGVKLSGGQRQRIAIARAMIKDAPILLLDEATSALDSESEKLIQDALWKLMEGRTAVVIAHRLSTIQKMDRIVVMEDGNIAEEGSHKELLEKDGVYASLWKHQSGGFIEE
jgi:ATP-binding cassette subfamily B protein